jgi:signal transduction histidine kinase
MNNQYKKQRLKLTALYLSIICAIVASLSLVIVHLQNRQLRRFEPPPIAVPVPRSGMVPDRIRLIELSEEEKAEIDRIVAQIRRENIQNVLILDALIILLSAIASYYLAGKTIEPIINSLEKQKKFVSDASHELKTPLTNIMTEAEILYRDKNTSNEEYRGFAKNVMEDIKHLNNLVVSLLDTAKLDGQLFNVTKSEVDVVELVRDTAQRFTEYAKKKDVEISVTAEKEPVLIVTDKVLMQRLLSIFIDNGIKYNREHGTLELIVHNKSKNSVRIDIKDSGVGIREENLKKIFDRFFRESEDRNEKGFGLGLSIAKQLAEILNVRITVDSEVGKGTIFTLDFQA